MAIKYTFTERNTECLLDIATEIIQLLTDAGQTIGVAESLTGGGLMAALTSVPGASATFRGGVVSYATPLKEHLLKVDGDLIKREGVIHGDVASQMAEGARQISMVDGSATTWGLGTTGVAGPATQDGKPVGMVYIGLASPEMSRAIGPFHFSGTRDRIREATVVEALWQLREALRLGLGGNGRVARPVKGPTVVVNEV